MEIRNCLASHSRRRWSLHSGDDHGDDSVRWWRDDNGDDLVCSLIGWWQLKMMVMIWFAVWLVSDSWWWWQCRWFYSRFWPSKVIPLNNSWFWSWKWFFWTAHKITVGFSPKNWDFCWFLPKKLGLQFIWSKRVVRLNRPQDCIWFWPKILIRLDNP